MKIEELINLLENGDDMASWDAAYTLIMRAPKMDRRLIKVQISRVLNVVRSKAGFRKANAITVLGKLFQYAEVKEEILDTLLFAIRDPDENTRRASIFALSNCISDETRDKILKVFENLLEDKAKTVKYGALEIMTEVLPHKISNKTFDRILGFLEADESWIRWRAVLAINKAYFELNISEKEKAVSVLRGIIEDKDIFVKVRAYEALLNIKDLEKRDFPEVDEALRKESDFVRQWVLYNKEKGKGSRLNI
jgi:HEAT repeat protein